MPGPWNGRFSPYEEEGDNDPNADFPIQETAEDFAGRKRQFEISMHELGLGFMVQADEVGADGLGYEFSAFDQASPYLALGKLRAKMQRTLATRHLTKAEFGFFPSHDTLRGRITSDDGEAVFVIDGTPLSLAQFGQLVATHEGFDFTLRFLDRGEEG